MTSWPQSVSTSACAKWKGSKTRPLNAMLSVSTCTALASWESDSLMDVKTTKNRKTPQKGECDH